MSWILVLLLIGAAVWAVVLVTGPGGDLLDLLLAPARTRRAARQAHEAGARARANIRRIGRGRR